MTENNDKMVRYDSRQELLNLIDMESLKEILNAFTTTTGLTANVVDVNGRSIFARKDVTKCCKFCKLIMAMDHGLERCQSAYKRAGRQAALFGEPYIFRCPAGLIEWAAPIMVNGRHLGSIICGQVLMWEPEEFFWIELREMNKSLTSDFKELFKAVEELPVVSGDTVQAASYLLYIVANFITKSGWEQKKRNEELLKQQLRLSEELETRKKLEEQLGQMFIYSMNKESDLMELIREGNTELANCLLNELTTEIILGSKGNMDVIRTRSIELIIMTSRTAVSAGVSQERTSQINASFIQVILQQNSIDDISSQLQMAIDIFQKEIQKRAAVPEPAGVKSMKQFMKDHYRENLTLENIAASAFLSSGYASRIFKKQMNISIMDYLLQLRMDEAKKMLRETTLSIDEIASKTGYADSSYFTKVFRKAMGMTPSRYRQSLKSK
ncbi:MAG: PocR ligand-binding domain-containing protein [Lachnospiraceae bacterium]|nr:PocR ligand-binding domain-containing protein [Lachnospiraceae bacterium]